MKAKLIQKKIIAEGVLEVVFDLPEEIYFDPGSYFFINLLNPKYNDEKGKERHFSIVNSPNERTKLKMATRMRDSAFKRSLAEMQEGDEVGIFGIAGSMILPKDRKKICMITGGIGITPFMSMLQYICEEKINIDVVLLYSNNNQKSAAYLDELKDLKKQIDKFEIILSMTNDRDWKGNNGFFDSDFIKRHVDDFQDRLFMLSGASKFVEMVKKDLKKMEIKEKDIVADVFLGY